MTYKLSTQAEERTKSFGAEYHNQGVHWQAGSKSLQAKLSMLLTLMTWSEMSLGEKSLFFLEIYDTAAYLLRVFFCK